MYCVGDDICKKAQPAFPTYLEVLRPNEIYNSALKCKHCAREIKLVNDEHNRKLLKVLQSRMWIAWSLLGLEFYLLLFFKSDPEFIRIASICIKICHIYILSNFILRIVLPPKFLHWTHVEAPITPNWVPASKSPD